jgi:hypothetical protein
MQQFFAMMGFVTCADGRFEPEREKIAIYVQNGITTHVARQILTGEHAGKWTSKLAVLVDIAHNSVDDLSDYGTVASFMVRHFNGTPPKLPDLYPPPPRLVTAHGGVLLP